MLAEAQQTHQRPAWNTGRIIGPKPPLKPPHIWATGQPNPLELEKANRELLAPFAHDVVVRGAEIYTASGGPGWG